MIPLLVSWSRRCSEEAGPCWSRFFLYRLPFLAFIEFQNLFQSKTARKEPPKNERGRKRNIYIRERERQVEEM